MVGALAVSAAACSDDATVATALPDCAEEIDFRGVEQAVCLDNAAVGWEFGGGDDESPAGVQFFVFLRTSDELEPWDFQMDSYLEGLTVFGSMKADEFEERNLFSDIIGTGMGNAELADRLCAAAVLGASQRIDDLRGLRGALCERMDPPEWVEPTYEAPAGGIALPASLMRVDGLEISVRAALSDRYLELFDDELIAAMEAGRPWTVDEASCAPLICIIVGANGDRWSITVRDDGYITNIERA